MKKIFIMLLLVTMIFSIALAQTNEPFQFSPPKEWRSERIPFPLTFAPELKYQGFEELRFAPGMFDAKSDSHFTYLFIWWLEGKPEITSAQLEQDLVNYFKGLTDVVGKSKKKDYDLSKIHAKVTQLNSIETKLPYQSKHYRAVIETFDPFASEKLLTLNMEISIWDCDEAQKRVGFFAASPRPLDQEVWQTMRSVRDSFRCKK